MLHRLEALSKKHSLALVLGAAALCYAQPAVGVGIRHTTLGHVPLTGWKYDLLTLALSFIMLSASVQCQPRDFVAVSRSRAKLPFAASVYLVGPLLGLVAGIIALLTLGQEVAQPISLGLVLLGLMPIAMTSAAWVRMNGGNVPLLLGAIVVTNTIAVPLVPVVLRRLASSGHSAVGATMHASTVVEQLTLAILVPVAIGMTLRTLAPKLVDRIRPVLSLLSTTALLMSLGSTVSASRPHIEANVAAIATAAAFTLTFNVALYFAGIRLIRLTSLNRNDAVTVLFASGMRNMGAAMVVAAVAFPDSPLVAIPAAVFSISQQLLGGAMTSLLESRPDLVDVELAEEEEVEEVFVRAPMRSRPQTIPSIHPPPDA